MKKFLTILLSCVLLLSAAACSSETPAPTTVPAPTDESTTVSTQPRERVTLSIGMPDNAKITSFDENALTQWVEQQCDVELEFWLYGNSSPVYEYPDILFGIGLSETSLMEYVQEGTFLDLTAYYEDKEGASKNFWDRMAQCLTPQQQTDVLDRITNADDGKIYGVPSIVTYVSDDRTFQPWINQVWLDQLGLEMPQNTEELYHVLKTFKEADPSGNGGTIPLFGSEKVGGVAQAVDWLINMFIYYNPDSPWQDYNGDGQLELVYTQEAYRKALQFIHKLYREGLLSNMLYTANSSDMKGIVTPDFKNALCGIFLGDLTRHTIEGSDFLYEYTPMPIWGYAVEKFSCTLRNFITKDCTNPDRAFEVLMTLWSLEGTMRVRYGEYGENWTDADPGAVSPLGYPATYKILEDPMQIQNAAHWGNISCGLFDCLLDDAYAQVPDNLSEWLATKGQMEAASRVLFEEAKSRTPDNFCPYLPYTLQQRNQINEIHYPIFNLAAQYEKNFVQGFVPGEQRHAPLDINSDADWDAFQQELEALGLAQYTQIVQTAWERQQ